MIQAYIPAAAGGAFQPRRQIIVYCRMIEAETLAERVQVEQIVVTAGVAPGGDPDVVIDQALDGFDGHGGRIVPH